MMNVHQPATAFCTGKGHYDTNTGTITPYGTITGKEIAQMVVSPESFKKEEAPWLIPSTYAEADARSHDAQRQHGAFKILTVDLDAGNHALEEVKEALGAVVGDVAWLTYATSSATADRRKWRALVPLSAFLTGAEWSATQTALFDMLGEQGIECDYALNRTGQLVYLPNKGDFYEYHINTKKPALTLDGHRIAAFRDETARKNAAAEAAIEADRKRKAAEREELHKTLGYSDSDETPIDSLNKAHSIADLLARYGYVQRGRTDHWRSPQQTSKTYATEDKGDHWRSLSGSDASAGVGRDAKTGVRFGDAFDLFAFYEHGNDREKAIKAWNDERNPGVRFGPEIPGWGVEALLRKIHESRKAKEEAADEQAQDTSDSTGSANESGEQEHENNDTSDGEPSACEILGIKSGADTATLNASDNHLIRRILPTKSFCALYGPPGSTKSFWALSASLAIARGDALHGEETDRGGVIYCALEGGAMFTNRVRAYVEHHGMDAETDLQDFHLVNIPLDLRTGPNHATLLAAAAEELGNVKLIVVDTLNRAFAGGNENNADDMGAFIARAGEIAHLTDATLLVVHHCGKNMAAGLRGHSSLLGAVDTELMVEVMGEGRLLHVLKNREGEGDISFGYTVETINLGITEKGHSITSLVVVDADAEEIRKSGKKQKVGGVQQQVLRAAEILVAEPEAPRNPGGTGWPEPGEFAMVPAEKVIEAAMGLIDPPEDGGKDRRREAIIRAMNALVDRGHLGRNDGRVWVIRHAN